jgi:ATP-dependent Clp protease ATP-binding subunit ClpC
MIVFRQLDKADVERILELEVSKVRDRLSSRRIELNLTDSARDFLISKGYDPAYGARPLRRAIERYLEDRLAEEILKGNIHDDDAVDVICEGEELKFEQLAGTS